MPRAGIICEKCGSPAVYEERDRWGQFVSCITCGWDGHTLEAPAKMGREPVMPDGPRSNKLAEED